MKKVVIFGGGTGLSQILKGLKLFPIDVTAVVTVADSGRSTGKLRNELNIPAVGDISKVLLSMSNTSDDIINLMNYRFPAGKELEMHSIKNLILAALLEQKGDFRHALPIISSMLNIKGRVLPITEENVNLVGLFEDGTTVVGEEKITNTKKKLIKIKYDKKVSITKDVNNAIKQADLIIFSSGSLITSIIPNLIVDGLSKAIKESSAKKLYICNLVTQPGETDSFKVSDHIKKLYEYLPDTKLDAVIANNYKISSYIAKKYSSLEQKDPVILDEKELTKMDIKVIKDKLYKIENGMLRHDSLKVAYLIFSYLMEGK